MECCGQELRTQLGVMRTPGRWEVGRGTRLLQEALLYGFTEHKTL